MKLECDEIVTEFCYLGDMLEKYNSTGKAVPSRIPAGLNLNNCLVRFAAEYSLKNLKA